MKKILLILAVAGLCTAACAQTDKKGVAFQETTMAELQKQSADTGKPIFVDVYATWCGPCKYMANNVFTQDKAGAYFNANFVNAKFDAEKGEGREVARKYQVTAYPTFLILDSDGKELGRVVGGAEVDDFIRKVQGLL